MKRYSSLILDDVIFEKFEEHGTFYFLLIAKSETFTEAFGGSYLVTLGVGNRGSSYFLNEGLYHPSYIKEKYPFLSDQDAKILCERVNSYLFPRERV